ncbi:2OG-Fe(II) oxygenase [Shewanella xiamenensis]|uniref:2OG-Fe(II) oxygenase n=1 Tax=Shewanella xiamenensis TaxID=332186 RepID=A0AAE4Q013_9GAMM|nr:MULTISPECIES: 2OG-Fe(II) oxygenase [Shewanella]PZP30885.1 MAG: proline hydroxylase [Shewanella oneidensis]KEK27487.1 prolyl 4-hydroxylase subunit alpha [Shewanella xiamenensis]MDH1628496.1 2OG-Fe(II) oxygenase [Shewanella xiamenensis]MDV5391303.1 2OG-Fe(II) oxygenase [Shewanella xiamenensis]BDQ65137.1 prolyl 4-hydroxylase subunit alpha [Shewanella xiamenensis]
MVSQLSEAVLDVIADALVDKGYIFLPELVPSHISQVLLEKVRTTEIHELKAASIGRGAEQQLNPDIRRDRIQWLEEQHEPDSLYLDLMMQLKDGLNRRLFMGLFDYESHYAVYQPGAFYKKHVDALKGSQNRILTTVFFLNPDWAPADCGELIIYDEADNEIERIAPKMGHFVIFLSERFPHEVTKTLAQRNSIAGWFRVSTSMHGF